MKTVLVTGGCGFIGSHFVRLLHERTTWRIVNLDKLTYAGDPVRVGDLASGDRYRFVRGDIADRPAVQTLFREERPWAVVNFAAESHVDRSILDASPFLETNVAGAQSLLEAARRHPVERFVQISTDEVYGDLEEGGCASEDSPLRPSSPYAASKAAADLLCLAYRRTYGLPVLITRSSNNYGAWQFPEKLIPLMIRNVLAGEPLPVYGDGMQQRDWMYVEDNCVAVLLLLERGDPGAIYNIGTGLGQTNLEIVRSLCRVLATADESSGASTDPASSIRLVPDRPGHDRRYATDAGKLRRGFGWFPRVGFDEGLVRTVRWYLDHRDWLGRAASGGYRDYRDAVYARNWGRIPG